MYVYWFIHAFCVLFNDVAWGDKLWLIFPLYPWRDKLWLLLPTWLYCESIGGGIYVDIYVSTEHAFRAAQVQYKELCCKQSAGTEVVSTICSFWFPIILVLCTFPVIKSRRNTHQSILQPWHGMGMSLISTPGITKKNFNRFCFMFQSTKSNVQVHMHSLLMSKL